MKRYFDCGASAYFLWNMVLDDTGLSSWSWKQTVDGRSGGDTLEIALPAQSVNTVVVGPS